MTVHKIIDYYLKKGIISLVGKGMSTEEGGKKPNLFSFNPDCRYFFAVRLDEDTLALAVVNLKGTIVGETEKVSMRGASFSDFLQAVCMGFAARFGQDRLPLGKCICTVIAFNGLVDIENGVCLAAPRHPDWGFNLPVRERLSAMLPPEVPVQVDSWFRYQAYGEILASDPGSRQRFYLMGTHADLFSGGMIIDGGIYRGNMGLSGEIGHMVVAPNSENMCRCGGRGCLETEVVPSRVVSKAISGMTSHPDSLIFRDADAGSVTFADVAKAADAGDPLARTIMDESARHFAVAVNNVVHTCDPGHIIIHGDYARAGDYFMDNLRASFKSIVFPDIDRRTRIEASELGEEWSLIGAAYLTTDDWIASRMD